MINVVYCDNEYIDILNSVLSIIERFNIIDISCNIFVSDNEDDFRKFVELETEKKLFSFTREVGIGVSNVGVFLGFLEGMPKKTRHDLFTMCLLHEFRHCWQYKEYHEIMFINTDSRRKISELDAKVFSCVKAIEYSMVSTAPAEAYLSSLDVQSLDESENLLRTFNK